MRRMAEGRAHLLALARTRESFDLDDAVHYWPDASLPSSTELSEWIGALVSEGLLKAVGQPDGPVRFAATEAARKGDEDEEPLSVDLDPELLEEALSQRARARGPVRGRLALRISTDEVVVPVRRFTGAEAGTWSVVNRDLSSAAASATFAWSRCL